MATLLLREGKVGEILGIFNKIFGSKKANSVNENDDFNRVYIFDTDYPLDKSDWNQIFSASVAPIITVQNACARFVVKDRNWSVNFNEGLLSFGSDSYPVQLIGTESSIKDTWLWGWENINGFDEKIIGFSNVIKNIGEEWNFEAFTKSEFDITDTFNGHNIAMVATFVTRNKYCYYRGPHSNGAVLLAFSGAPKEVFKPIESIEFTQIILDIIQKYNVNHKILVESFLMWNGTSYEWVDNNIIAHFNQDLCIMFEHVNDILRIKEIKSLENK